MDFTDASLWRAVNPMFSNDAALQLGARLAAGTELQFLFADRFGLFENSREVFVYNSRMLEGATGGQLAQLQANIAAARTAGLQVVDIGSGFLDPVWKAVDVPFVAQDGASAQQLKTGALVGDMRDPRYLTINLTRSLAVQAVDGVVSAYSDHGGPGLAQGQHPPGRHPCRQGHHHHGQRPGRFHHRHRRGHAGEPGQSAVANRDIVGAPATPTASTSTTAPRRCNSIWARAMRSMSRRAAWRGWRSRAAST